MANEDDLRRRYKEFVDLMPLTLSLAGLPSSEGKQHYTTEQMELRAHVIANAFKIARDAVRDSVVNDT